MKKLVWITCFVTICSAQTPPTLHYSWKDATDPGQALVERIPVPTMYERVAVDPGSYADWLRHFPLKPGRPAVYLHSGLLKRNQQVHEAVLDIDVGKADLQQCADAVMRLRAEYLFSIKYFGNIHYNFTNGFWFGYAKWREGFRVKVTGNKAEWTYPSLQVPDKSYANFRKYMDVVFTYCGTQSLSAEMKPIDLHELMPGDMFIKGGSPGHAVVVMDVAKNTQTGKKIFLLAQSYMPAQDVHVLRNLNDPLLSPWYSEDFGDILQTPEWTFSRADLKRFRE